SAIYALVLQTNITGNPGRHTLFRFNTNAAGDCPDYWFEATNRESIAFVSDLGAAAAKMGAIKVIIEGVDQWIYTYAQSEI
ncbi:unnamed protein product, partial [marine sediment metagenome]